MYPQNALTLVLLAALLHTLGCPGSPAEQAGVPAVEAESETALSTRFDPAALPANTKFSQLRWLVADVALDPAEVDLVLKLAEAFLPRATEDGTLMYASGIDYIDDVESWSVWNETGVEARPYLVALAKLSLAREILKHGGLEATIAFHKKFGELARRDNQGERSRLEGQVSEEQLARLREDDARWEARHDAFIARLKHYPHQNLDLFRARGDEIKRFFRRLDGTSQGK